VIATLAIMALALVLGMPKITAARESAQLESAKTQLSSYITAARFAAIRRGATAQVKRTGNRVSVTVTVSGVQQVLRSGVDLSSRYGVSLANAPDSVAFDPRGFVIGATTTAKFILAKGTRRDSLCVTTTGFNSTSAAPCSL
jgi:Tfp pilus assembly protein FimT